MTDLCNCGSVEDAAHRAFELWKKMMNDDECPLFIFVQARMFEVLAGGAIQKRIQEKLDSKDPLKAALGRLIADALAEEVRDQLNKDLLKTFTEQKYEIRCQRAYTHNEERLKDVDHCDGSPKRK